MRTRLSSYPFINTFAMIIIGIAVVSMGVANTCMAQAEHLSQDEKIVLSAKSSEVVSGASIKILAKIINIADHSVVEQRWPKDGYPSLHLIVRNDQGQVVKRRRPDQSPCKGRPGCEIIWFPMGRTVDARIKPGKFVVEVFNVSKDYDLTKPGKYSIQVVRGAPRAPSLVSNVISVTVLPPNN